MAAIGSVISAFGLSGAAGLNAFIPLLTVAVLGRLGVIDLAAPFDVLASGPAIAVLSILLGVEIVIDKVPGADHVNDVVQTFVRPAAGAVLFGAEAGLVDGVPGWVWLLLGLVTALGVHGTKTAARPIVTASTLGVGTPILSAVEDLVAVLSTFLAIFLPILFVILAALFIGVLVWAYRSFRSRPKHAPAPDAG